MMLIPCACVGQPAHASCQLGRPTAIRLHALQIVQLVPGLLPSWLRSAVLVSHTGVRPIIGRNWLRSLKVMLSQRVEGLYASAPLDFCPWKIVVPENV